MAGGFATVRHWDNVPEAFKGLSVALGNFDGLHRGHIAVLDAARAAAGHRGCGWGLVTFEPPPRLWFNPSSEAFRIMTPARRAVITAEMGASAVFELPFDGRLAALTDEEFVVQVLHEGLGITHVSVGADYRFGRARMGDTRSLARHAIGVGIGVSTVEALGVQEGPEKISSSAIRDALREGRPRDAARALGRWWVAEGEVVHGEKRGRTLGFPTANITLGELVAPRFGVYAVRVRIDGAEPWHAGVASFGRTPTTGLRDALLETVLFDWQGDLYGRWLEVALMDFLRPEERFDSLEALVAQMWRDAEAARVSLDCGHPAIALPSLPRI
jgi:riboflavin kinase/FMN adenylyltransferase